MRAHKVSFEAKDPAGKRRHFSAQYKLGVLREAEACEKAGEVGALLRREGLYFSHLTNWRTAREKGELAGLEPRKRGRKPKHADPRDRLIAQLRRDNQRLESRAERAEKLVEMQRHTRTLAPDPAGPEDRSRIVELIRAAAGDVGVRSACDAFGVSRASFYRWSVEREASPSRPASRRGRARPSPLRARVAERTDDESLY